MDTSSERDVTDVGALADPLRRRLYEYVVGSGTPVPRDEAARAVGVSRHQAKFHLDRLVEADLLQADYARVSGRSGPGAGRPAKVYRRSARQLSVTLPDRRYEVAGSVMAAAIAAASASGSPVLPSLDTAATEAGRRLASGTERADREGLEAVLAILAGNGYEPRRSGHRAVLRNCPFHALVAEHPELVCRMNHALVSGVIDALEPADDRESDAGPGTPEIRAHLDPGENRCCVTITADPPDATGCRTCDNDGQAR